MEGRDIPLPARIVAAAEAFDLLTSSPQCNSADQVAAAMSSMRSRKDTEFDLVCVEALSCQLEKTGEIIATIADPVCGACGWDSP